MDSLSLPKGYCSVVGNPNAVKLDQNVVLLKDRSRASSRLDFPNHNSSLRSCHPKCFTQVGVFSRLDCNPARNNSKTRARAAFSTIIYTCVFISHAQTALAHLPGYSQAWKSRHLAVGFKVFQKVVDHRARDDVSDVFCVVRLERLKRNAYALPSVVESWPTTIPCIDRSIDLYPKQLLSAVLVLGKLNSRHDAPGDANGVAADGVANNCHGLLPKRKGKRREEQGGL